MYAHIGIYTHMVCTHTHIHVFLYTHVCLLVKDALLTTGSLNFEGLSLKRVTYYH